MSASLLPPGFEALEPFVPAWALDTAEQRHRARLASTEADRQAFFAVAKDLLAPGLDQLDRTPPAAFTPDEQRLMQLLLSVAHVALAVETQGADEARHAEVARHMTITRAPSDSGDMR